MQANLKIDISPLLLLESLYPHIYRAALGHQKNQNEKSQSALLTALERELKVSVTDSDVLVSTQDLVKKTEPSFPLVFVLDNIRSAFNIGSALRLANAINAEEIFLNGYTAGIDHPAVKKASLGAESFLKVTETANLENTLSRLKEKSFKIIALETAKPSTDLFSWKAFKGPTAIWIGNERFGIENEKLKMADVILSIPMFGTKNSLNVAQALSVASYEWLRQYRA